MSALLRRHARTLLGAGLGAVGGGLYAHFVGCRTGTCAITSSVWSSALFFGFTGAIALMPGAPKPASGPAADAADPR